MGPLVVFAWMSSVASAAPVAVDLEWRGNAYADHLSHGPGVALSWGMLGDHLRVGLAGFARPGPINPATFTLELDTPYNGKNALELRSDGGAMGLLVQPGTAVGRGLRLDVPVMLGYGGYGFYLTGEDRETPDGALPSVWEDALMDGRDSAFGLVVDGGLRLTARTAHTIQPYVTVRGTTVLGYDAYLADGYAGASVGVGVTVVARAD